MFLDHLAISPKSRKPWSLPPVPEPEKSIPTIEEGRALWNAIQKRYHNEYRTSFPKRMAAIALAMFGGCEKGVVAGLMWEDVDWVGGVINIRRSFAEHRDGIKPPKNQYRVRTIPMSNEIRDSLTTIWEREHRPVTGYVLNGGRDNRRISVYKAIGDHYVRLSMLQAGFVDADGKPRWSFHELRHYAGSIWLEAGARVEDVSRMLGHSNINTTMKYYIHYFQKQEAERHRLIADRVSAMHQLPGNPMALPAPMREICEIDGEVVDTSGKS